MPALLALLLRRRPALLSVVAVLLALAAIAVTALHDLATWVTGHPLTVTSTIVAAAAVVTAATRRHR